MNVYQLKNRTDVLIWLSLIEGDLLSIQASLNAGLYPLYDDRQEEPDLNVRYLTVVWLSVNLWKGLNQKILTF